MQIGRKIYYDLPNGNIILNRESRSGSAVTADTTTEQDFVAYASLAERVPSTVGFIQLEYGEYDQDFMECNGYAVDISGTTPTLVFSYPDPSAPEAPPVYRAPLSVEVDDLKTQNAEIILALVMNDLM
jgi:hypothetical protein